MRVLKPFNRDQIETARSRCNYALAKGKIVRTACAVCGAVKTEGHHDDYTKPLDVVFLCRAHHNARHRELGWR